ncbi:MAG: hypothetical protein ABIX01_14495, partial [Chitinophagaceae bacterium]
TFEKPKTLVLKTEILNNRFLYKDMSYGYAKISGQTYSFMSENIVQPKSWHLHLLLKYRYSRKINIYYLKILHYLKSLY